MRINKISRLHNVGVFRQFDWPVALHSFAQYNLIYGWNGTGKSTLSRVLHCLESKRVPEGTVKLIVDENEIDGASFPTSGVSIRVFDRDFVDRTVRASTQPDAIGPEMPAIFVIGEKNVENQKKADEARRKLADWQSKLLDARSRDTAATDAIDKFCTDQAKLIKDLLTKTGSAYNNYNRASFKNKVEALSAEGDLTPFILDDAALADRIQKHQSTLREKLTEVSYSLPNLEAAYDDLTQMCGRIVTSEAIESLRIDPDVAEWVKTGLELHKNRDTQVCLYCDQPVPPARLESLRKHFNDAYQKFVDDIVKRVRRMESLEAAVRAVVFPKKAELYDHLASKLEEATPAAEALLKQVTAALDFLKQNLRTKQTTPFAVVAIAGEAPKLNAIAIDAVNAVIAAHNQHSDDFSQELKDAREEVESAKVAAVIDKYKQLVKDSEATADSIDKIIGEIDALNTEIATLDRELREHQKPADDLNRDLQHYLGHPDLQLTVLDAGYRIMRGGQTATRLSEGEQTAISLLYFLKSLSSTDFRLDSGIVVLDDPVCSLDANALFSAFGYIKERTKGAKQLFILTHNFMFFRQVRRWFHKLPNQRKNIALRPARFYMVRCAFPTGQRQSEICWLDRLLEEYESDYHYTFFLVHQLASDPIKPLESYFVAPNLARKLMETFLAFHAPGPGGEVSFAKLEDVPYDENKKTRVLRFLNEHSHSGAVGGDQQDFSNLGETQAVLKDLLSMIEAANRAHYDGMIALVTEAP